MSEVRVWRVPHSVRKCRDFMQVVPLLELLGDETTSEEEERQDNDTCDTRDGLVGKEAAHSPFPFCATIVPVRDRPAMMPRFTH